MDMSAAPYHVLACHEHCIDGGLAGDEHIRIDPAVFRYSGEVRMARIEHHEIGPAARRDGANLSTERLGAAGKRLVIETASGRLALLVGQNIAGAMLEALAVLELLEFS